jgi:hypothetical protein
MATPPPDLFVLTRVDRVTGEVERVPAHERMDAILSHPDGPRIIRSMDAQTLFGWVSEAGLSDSLDLIAYTTPEQVRAFIDFDCWTGDQFELTRFLEWLPVVLDRDDEGFAEWYEATDIELLALLLQDACAVYLMEEDRDYLDTLEDAVVSSPCGVYAIIFPDEDAPVEQVRMLLDRVYGMNLVEGHRLLESVRWELRSGMEEQALHARTARMGDLGWVPYHEAWEVFAWRDPRAFADEARRRALSPSARPIEASGDLPPVDQHLQALDAARSRQGETLLHRALAALAAVWEASDVERIAMSFAAQFRALTNRAHTAERGVPGDVEATAEAVGRVVYRLSTGLQLAAHDDVALAARVLATTPLRELHQAGHSAVVRLAQSARSLVRRGQLGVVDGAPLSLLEAGDRDLMEGLLESFPVRSRVGGEIFETLDHVEQAAARVASVAFAELLFFGLLRHTRTELIDLLYDAARSRTPVEMVSFRSLFATLVLHRAAQRPVELEPISLQSFDEAVVRMRRAGDLWSEVRGHVQAVLRDHARVDESATPVARLWSDAVSAWLAEELEGIHTPVPAEIAVSIALIRP